MERAVPVVQERLKPLGFVRGAKSTFQHVTIQEGKSPQLENLDRWDFFDADKSTAVLLTRDFVLLQTNKYSTFEVFCEQLSHVLEIVKQAAGMDFAERLGLRFVDLVRHGNEMVTAYLKPGVTGYPFEQVPGLTTLKTTFSSQSLAVTPVGVLSIRCHQAEGQFLPPDIMPPILDYPWSLSPGEKVTVLDFDHYSDVTRRFEAPALIDSMWELHDVIGIAFRNVITDHALRRWEVQV